MKQYVVDAFSKELFHGNQAAVCLPDAWPSEELMKNIARENNFSETAFVVREGARYRLRWFTPGGEVDLCGHATLATAFVLFEFVAPDAPELVFVTQSGELTVTRREAGLLEMQFPAYALQSAPNVPEIAEALGAAPKEVWLGRDLLCVFDDESVVRQMTPEMAKVAALPGLLVHATAPGRETDCVSRSFAPKLGVPEDPVCGSGHCHIAPYWSRKLGKSALVAYQASSRGGVLYCRVAGDMVFLAGHAVLFSQGTLCVK